MRIQHNIAAINSNRQLASNNTAIGKNLEKLSSGYKINRAGDDAAGLAISEKMRAQITGLSKATDNANDGISLVQTAEGALTEVHSMLNRMTELATQSSNGTYDNDTDRKNLQKEVDSLISEIDRISESTNFNGIKLLDGSLNKAATSTNVPKQLKDPTVTGLTDFKAGMVDAVAEKTFIAVGTLSGEGADANFDVYKVDFTDETGTARSFTLAEGSKAAVTASSATTLASALNGDGKLSLATGGTDTEEAKKQAAAYEDFKKLFTVSGDGTGLSITAKTAGATKASYGAITVGSASTGVTAAVTALGSATALAKEAVSTTGDTTAAKSIAGQNAGYRISLGTGTDKSNQIAAGNTLTVGDKTYEFVDGTDAPTGAGNIGVTRGATDDITTKNLMEQLKKDGYDVSIDANEDEAIIFNKPEQLKVDQRGTLVTTAMSSVNITKTEPTKAATTLTMGVGANAGNQEATVRYQDKNGDMHEVKVAYTSANGSGAANASGLFTELEKNEELKGVFDITKNADKISFTAKLTGSSEGMVVGITTDDIATAISKVDVVAGKDTGKEVAFGKNPSNGETITVGNKTYQFVTDQYTKPSTGNTAIIIGSDREKTLDALTTQLKADGVKFSADLKNGKISFADKDGIAAAETQKEGLTLQIGDTADSFNKVTVNVGDMSTKSLGLSGLKIEEQNQASDAIKKIKEAINNVSSTRGDLGAVQNRLEHTINNLGVTVENMTSAEARIRDTDMAKEMMQYTKNNILVQASQAMLAQANKLPQGVLQLLG